MGERLKGKVAIVTGGGRGIGRAHCIGLAEEGAKVVVNDLGGSVDGSGSDLSPAEEVVAEIKKMGGDAIANGGSVVSYKDAEDMVRQAIDSFGKLDILINNAGVLRDRMLFNMSEEEWDIVMKVHAYGHFNTTRHACAYFRQRHKEDGVGGGRIVNTASAAGWGNLGQANYSAAKEAIVGLTRTTAIDMARAGVTCNCIRPGAGTRMTMTDELKAAFERKQKEGVGGIAGGGADDSPLAGLAEMQPDMVTPMVVYLCTDAAAGITGEVFHCAGGNIQREAKLSIASSLCKKGKWTLDELDEMVDKVLMSSGPMLG